MCVGRDNTYDIKMTVRERIEPPVECEGATEYEDGFPLDKVCDISLCCRINKINNILLFIKVNKIFNFSLWLASQSQGRNLKVIPYDFDHSFQFL